MIENVFAVCGIQTEAATEFFSQVSTAFLMMETFVAKAQV